MVGPRLFRLNKLTTAISVSFFFPLKLLKWHTTLSFPASTAIKTICNGDSSRKRLKKLRRGKDWLKHEELTTVFFWLLFFSVHHTAPSMTTAGFSPEGGSTQSQTAACSTYKSPLGVSGFTLHMDRKCFKLTSV